ncbi:acyltransferase family protein [Sphingobacterium sp. GVS05A]|uniref:acyltransferase family protein n=1 Tax=Sphingobacterium sp. GVS05A TaxID=2862679 RepID=UPI001CBC7A52|nr:acyltransferase family protein [Sphingobacterium sp. GVS05A]
MGNANQVNTTGGLDIGKFIMSIVVVAIHTQPLAGKISGISLALYNFFIALAVPFFFVASGYLLSRKITVPVDYRQCYTILSDYLFRITKLYVIWTILYLPLTIYGFYQQHTDPLLAFALFFRNIFLRGENYYSWPLWYLMALIYTLMVLLIFLKKQISPQFILVYAFGSYFVACSWDIIVKAVEAEGYMWLKIWHNSFGSVRVFTALTFVVLGLYLGLSRRYWSKTNILITSIGAVALGFFEIPLLSELCILVGAYAVFQLFVLSFPWLSQAYGKKIRKVSTVIYFTHMLVFFTYQSVFYSFQLPQWVGFLFTVLVTISLAFWVLRYEQRVSWLNKIF